MRTKLPYRPAPTASHDEIQEILGDRAAWPEPAAQSVAAASVPVRLQSNYYWNPFSLLCGLCDAALPELTAPAWKVVTVITIRQLAAATLGADAPHRAAPIALSITDLMRATRLSRMTVLAAIRAAAEADWLAPQKRRTPHGGNAVALYSVNWKRAEQAERRRRKARASSSACSR